MKIKSLQKVVEVRSDQYVRINDQKNNRVIESLEGWVFEPDYEYEGFNYDEIERILNLNVSSVKFSKYFLTIYAY